MAYILILGPE